MACSSLRVRVVRSVTSTPDGRTRPPRNTVPDRTSLRRPTRSLKRVVISIECLRRLLHVVVECLCRSKCGAVHGRNRTSITSSIAIRKIERTFVANPRRELVCIALFPQPLRAGVAHRTPRSRSAGQIRDLSSGSFTGDSALASSRRRA